jgi:PTS system mannose-specific IIA component
MIGVVIVTHGNLAREFRAALEHVVGPQDQIATICITPDDDMEERRRAIMQAVESVDTGDGAVLLTDMFGGTPSNLALSIMDQAKVEVIAGINLPMLVKLARVREESDIQDAIRQAQDAGRRYIHVASHVLSTK